MDWLELIKSVEQKREELALQSARSNLLMSGYWIILFKDFNIGRVEVLEVFMCKEPAFKRFGEYCREDYPGLEYASEFEWLSRDGKKELSIVHKGASNRDLETMIREFGEGVFAGQYEYVGLDVLTHKCQVILVHW